MMSNSQQPTIQEKVTSKWFSELPADILGGQGNVRDKDSEETKEREGKVTSRVVAVPCRARGMTMDHNFQVSEVLHHPWISKFATISLIVCIYQASTHSCPPIFPVTSPHTFKYPRTFNMEISSFVAIFPAGTGE